MDVVPKELLTGQTNNKALDTEQRTQITRITFRSKSEMKNCLKQDVYSKQFQVVIIQVSYHGLDLLKPIWIGMDC